MSSLLWSLFLSRVPPQNAHSSSTGEYLGRNATPPGPTRRGVVVDFGFERPVGVVELTSRWSCWARGGVVVVVVVVVGGAIVMECRRFEARVGACGGGAG